MQGRIRPVPWCSACVGLVPVRYQLLLLWLVCFSFLAAQADEAASPSLNSESSSSGSQDGSQDIVALIDRQIRLAWEEHGVQPSKTATDGEWCRRLFLDVLGRIPTVQELDRFVAERSRTKRRELVDRLLGPEYQNDYARNWTTYWTNTLIGRTGGTNRRDRTSRSGMMAYLEESLRENKPYDLMVRELLTATGSTTPEAEDFNGAVNFLADKLEENAVQATTKTSEIFLGMAVGCTQCHNHPFNEHRQNRFWELNAFFRQMRIEVTRDPDNNGRVANATIVNRDFAGEGRILRADNRREIYLEEKDGKLVDRDAASLVAAPVFYELRNGQVRVAYPVFVDGTSLADKFAKKGPEYGNSGTLKNVERRQELADLIQASHHLELAIVNRMWAHFLGRGFTKPIHDMGPHNPPSHPELLESLAKAFRDTRFDLKQLVRWIVLSEPYSLSSRFSSGNKQDDPTLGGPPRFSRFYLRQMQAEQLYESLLIATQAAETVDDQTERSRMKDRWLRQFNTAFGTDDNAETSTFNGSIPQALMMMNGDLVRRASRTGSGSFLDQVATNPQFSNREKINHLYRAALARQPTKEEKRIGNDLLEARGGNVVGTLQDIWWAVLNSNEFILIH